jgi:hypothetical protein
VVEGPGTAWVAGLRPLARPYISTP